MKSKNKKIRGVELKIHRLVCEKLLDKRYKAYKIKREKVVPEKGGIYSIVQGSKVIYIGQSQNNIRRRLLAHLGGYDKQKVGKYLKKLKTKDFKKIYIAWVVIKNAKCLEHNYVQCITDIQKGPPKMNKTKGNSCD